LDLLEERDQQAMKEEIRLMKENPHPFIVKVIDDFIDSSGHLCMVQELYTEGDFCKLLIERGEK
jgi:serine/threonine protein kinase